jgi:heme/copper-type cytochrome/quinol oxidase subunit 4
MPYIGIQAKRLVLVLGDFAVFQIALALTLFIRYGHITEWNIHALPFSILGILWVISFYVAGLILPLRPRPPSRYGFTSR